MQAKLLFFCAGRKKNNAAKGISSVGWFDLPKYGCYMPFSCPPSVRLDRRTAEAGRRPDGRSGEQVDQGLPSYDKDLLKVHIIFGP